MESDAHSTAPFVALIACMIAAIAAFTFHLGLYLGRRERAQTYVEDLKVLCDRLLEREKAMMEVITAGRGARLGSEESK